jgi:tetratricopeptide (TPR) repeat protein
MPRRSRNMKMNKLSVLILILAVLIIGSIAYAQSENRGLIPRLIMQDKKGTDASQVGQMDLVRQLIATGAYMTAADLLEDMYSKQPENQEIISLLLNCYEQLKAYPKAELFLQSKIEASPFNLYYHDRLLDLYLKMGEDSLVDKQIDDMLQRFPGNPDIYQMIINKLTGAGYNDKAGEFIDRGRGQFGSDALFAMEAATLDEIKGDYYQAVMEYFKVIDRDSSSAINVDRKMAALIRYPGAPPDIIVALNDILDSLPNNKMASKFLQETYIQNNQFDKAFNLSLKFDSLSQSDGRELFKYMRQCRERKLYEQVVKAAEYIERLDNKNVPYADYKFYYAEALAGLGRYDEAIARYKEIAKEYPRPNDKAEALLKIGNVFRYDILDFDSAAVYYDSVTAFYRVEPVNSSAMFERAKLFLVKGDLDSSRQVFSELKEISKSAEMKELMDFNLAMIQFFKKDFADADLSFRRIIKTYPRGYFVNDALINSLIIGESSQQVPQALSDYADALCYELRMKPDSVIDKYKSIIAQGESPLIGTSMYRLAIYYSALADTSDALAVIDSMEADYPDDYFFPYAFKLKADIYAASSDKQEIAAKIYKDILQKYSSYPFIGEVREALQKIESSRPVG